MLKKNKIKITTATILAVVMVGLFTVSLAASAKADENSTYLPIVEKLSEKFRLNKDEVQQVFEDDREERQADMYASLVEKLDDLVNSGQITQEQKDTLLAKHEEMHNKMMDLRNSDSETRRDEMQKLHDEFDSWAKENGIDLKSLGIGMGFRGERGPEGPKGPWFGDKPSE